MAIAATVTIGFVVKKRWVKDQNGTPKSMEKIVSQRFGSMAAAETFRNLALADAQINPKEGESRVEFYVTNDIGHDGLPEEM